MKGAGRIDIRRAPNIRHTTIKEAIEGGRQYLKYEERLNLSLNKGTLVDLETKDLESDVPITLGMVRRDVITIYQLLTEDYGAIERIASAVKFQEPLIAFNAEFERSIFERLGIPGMAWKELQQPVPYIDDSGQWQHFEKACMKKEFYVSLTPIDYMAGRVVPHLWQLYLLMKGVWKKARLIYDIMRHNRQCLLKELAIVMMGEGYRSRRLERTGS